MKLNRNVNWSIIVPILVALFQFLYGQYNLEEKELTICEERQIDVFNTFDDDFIIYTKDSLRLDNHRIIEYSITNTGNTTIVGTGLQSDLLVDGNSLRIANDSVIVKISGKDESVKLFDNHIRFKQIRPNEKITLICASNQNIENHLVYISDRDIKDVNIVYTKRNNRLTTFEKTTSTNRWLCVGGFLLNLMVVLAIVAISFLEVAKELKTWKKVLLFLSFLCLIYTLMLPIRWLL